MWLNIEISKSLIVFYYEIVTCSILLCFNLVSEDKDVSLDETNLYDETTDSNYESPTQGSSRDSHVYTSMNNRRTVLL